MSENPGPVISGIKLQPTGTLTERAREALSAGPMHTTALAAHVLGLRSGAQAAAAVVFSLLGTDPRFLVDGSGVWSLAAPLASCNAESLMDEEWVVVDVETTGGSPRQGHRVTEIAAVRVSDGKIRETFSSLINPERHIPSLITSITGISDDMVQAAPRFHEVVPRLMETLGDRVFVAHNAAFDWCFVCSEMERAVGSSLHGRQLCTVRLARKLLPQLPSRSLDGLAVYFGLDIAARHRALDDAVATAKVLIHFIQLLEEREITDWTKMQQLLARRAARRKRRAMPGSMDSA